MDDLNVAVSTATELFEDNDMVFPDVLLGRENLKILASPGSESSGVSSLDAEEAKKLASEPLTSNTPTSDSESNTTKTPRESESSDGSDGSDGSDATDDDHVSDEKQSEQKINLSEGVVEAEEEEAQSATVETETIEADVEEQLKELIAEVVDAIKEVEQQPEQQQETSEPSSSVSQVSTTDEDDELDRIRYEKLKIIYNGRDILDFSANVANKSWNVQYTTLPENTFSMYLANRLKNHRQNAGWDTDYTYETCSQCMFTYPVKFPDHQQQAAAAKVGAVEQSLPAAIQAIGDTAASLNGSAGIQNMTPTINNTNSAINANNSVLQNNLHNLAAMLNRNSPVNNLSALAQKLGISSSFANQSPNYGNNVNHYGGFNNNATGHSGYANNTTGHGGHNGGFANNAGAGYQYNTLNNMPAYKQQNVSTNAFYGNNSNNVGGAITLNQLANQVGLMNMANGMGNNSSNNIQQINNLNNANPGNPMNNRQFYAMCRQNFNRSGINNINNSHSKMPPYKMYSHF